MANDQPIRYVTRSWSDSTCATGESLVKCSDGSVWKVYHVGSPGPRGTGETHGTLRSGGRITVP